MSRILVGDEVVDAELSGGVLRTPDGSLPIQIQSHPDGCITVTLDGRTYSCRTEQDQVWVDGRVRSVRLAPAKTGRVEVQSSRSQKAPAGTPPMPGVVTRIYVEVGAMVEVGDPLVAMTAMKMEHVLKAPTAGRIRVVLVSVGASVKTGQNLVEIE